jgi:signal transduction histidine kinase
MESKKELENYVIELRASKSDFERQAAAVAELAENQAMLNERLQYEIDVKDKFFSIISHDLKSPFNSLLGLTQMMSEMADSFSKDKLVEYATSVNEAGTAVFALLQNLLEWARLQMEGATLDLERISLQEIVQENINVLSSMAQEKNIALRNDIKITSAYADRNMVQTVVRNLIVNALKFTPPGGSVNISSQKNQNMVQVTVTDTGVGMSKEKAEMVFALDQKTSTTGTAGEIGTGLGLPLCKDMIERNGGRIWVESNSGKGSRFHFTLPSEPKSE